MLEDKKRDNKAVMLIFFGVCLCSGTDLISLLSSLSGTIWF